MQGPSILKINEMFWSFQGEGLRSGFPSIFLRLAGCSARCSYCDTRFAWKKGTLMTLDDIILEIDKHKKKYPCSQVVITGGEPMEQDLSLLVSDLKANGHYLSIETNGKDYQELDIDWWTVSPKADNDYRIHEALHPLVSEVKLIVTPDLTVDHVKQVRAIGDHFPIFLQPDWEDNDKHRHTVLLFQECQELSIWDVRCTVQLHKVYDVK